MSGAFARWQQAYAERRIATFPVIMAGHDKRPAVRGYLKLGTNVSRQLADKFPDHDAFGFALGARSRVTVLDVDTKDELVLADALGRHGSTPIIVRSGSGNFQAWFRHGGEPRRIRPWPELPIDLLGGGYIVAPPSKGRKGHYEFVSGGLDDLERLPVLANLNLTPRAPIESAPRSIVREGERNKSLWTYCMRRAQGMSSFNDLLALAHHRNVEFFPPLPNYEVVKIATSAWRYTERGENYFGGAWAGVIDALAAKEPDAFALLSILKRFHGASEEFALAKAMAQHMGWTVLRWRKAREQLERGGFIHCVHRGGKGPKDPPVYSWHARRRCSRKKGYEIAPQSYTHLPPSSSLNESNEERETGD